MRKLNKIITTAAMVAAILAGTAPKAAATGCPYTVGPLGRYIVPAQVQGMTADGDGVHEKNHQWPDVQHRHRQAAGLGKRW